MPESITKIMVRRGLDPTRRYGAGVGPIVFYPGEPAFCLDTKRLYIGDGTTEGGCPIGFKNHGSFSILSGSGTAGWDSSTYSTLSSNGIDVGDIVFDNQNKILFYCSTKDPLSAVPDFTSGLTRFDLLGRVTCNNGISSVKQNEVISTGLDPTIFTVDTNNFTVQADTTIGSPLANKGIMVNGTATVSSCTVGGNLAVGGSSEFAGVVTMYRDLYVNGVIDVSGLPGGNSTDWNNNWTTVNSNSADWEGVVTTVGNLFPLAWVFKKDYTTNPIISTYGGVDFMVGINTTPTIQGLSIQGSSSTSTALSVNGAIVATGDITALYGSDSRLKTNVKTLENVLDKLDFVRGVEFDWNCPEKVGHDFGVIAQELEQAFPNLVVTRSDGFKAVDYMKLISVLIQAVKELKAKYVCTST